MKGKIFGIGVGPGDPELLTLKAIKTMEECSVIAVPETLKGERTAFNIVKEYIQDKKIIECVFAMAQDMKERKRARLDVADNIAKYLDQGKNVGFITLGDPTTYSTYMYIHKILKEKGYEAQIIPGITSYSAAAAAFGIALCENDQPLTIIPAKRNTDLDFLLESPGNKVIMKSGENLKTVLEKLKEDGNNENVKIASRVTLEGERLFESIEEYEKAPVAGYFTLALVSENKD